MARKRVIFFFTIPSFLRKVNGLLLAAILAFICAVSLPVLSAPTPLESAKRGQELYEAGKLDKAIESWQQAADGYGKMGDRQSMKENLLNKATAQQALGLYNKSCETLLFAFGQQDFSCQKLSGQAETLNKKWDKSNNNSVEQVIKLIQPFTQEKDSVNQALALLRLGDFFRETDNLQVAETVLKLSLETAEKTGNYLQQGAALISLANTTRTIAREEQNLFAPVTTALNILVNQQASLDKTIEPYQKTIEFYQKAITTASSQTERLQAQVNYLSLLFDIKEFWNGAITEAISSAEALGDKDLTSKIEQDGKNLQSQLNNKLDSQIQPLIPLIESQFNNLPVTRANIYIKINFAESLLRFQYNPNSIAELLAKSAKEAQTLDNPNAHAQALVNLARVYEETKQFSEAKKLTEQALQLIPANKTPEIAYVWQRQLGRILNKQGDRESALAAYDASFNTTRAIRRDLAATPVEPIYREYIELLLTSNPTNSELSKAREVLESLQISEIDNYFRDPCSEIAAELVQIDKVDSKAAVIYPIILNNSLQLIVTLPGQKLQRYETKVSQTELEKTINELRAKALTNPEFSEDIRRDRGNNETIIKLQQDLENSLKQDILPKAQKLYQWLVAPAEPILQANKIETLVFVLDGDLRNIPMALLYDGEKYLIEKEYNVAITPGLQLTNPQPLTRKPIKVLAAGVTKSVSGKFPKIPKVEQELKLIKNIFQDSAEVLLEEEFTQSNLQQRIQTNNFPVVHLATHGQFSSNPEQTFIVSGETGEKEFINVRDLDNLLRSSTKNNRAIELLVLSACNTAEGDKKAVLGLAGVAVKAGAQSTLATLWAANDEATSQLMGYFYSNLKEENTSKAQALRKAQLALLKTPDSQYKHPYYWAPFVLIGNWL